jgi:hypothetical protein
METGQFVPLTPEQADKEQKRKADSIQAEIDRLKKQVPPFAHTAPIAIRHQWEENLPPRERRGPIFAVGEIVELKGAKFKVQQMVGTRMILKALPHQYEDK